MQKNCNWSLVWQNLNQKQMHLIYNHPPMLYCAFIYFIEVKDIEMVTGLGYLDILMSGKTYEVAFNYYGKLRVIQTNCPYMLRVDYHLKIVTRDFIFKFPQTSICGSSLPCLHIQEHSHLSPMNLRGNYLWWQWWW